jgi:hypothetical protein
LSRDASQAEPLVPNALARRLAKLIHPQLGIKRGIIDRVEPGKGSPDRDDRLIPVSIGEIREAHAVLVGLASAMSAFGQDPEEGLEAKPASAVPEGETPNA